MTRSPRAAVLIATALMPQLASATDYTGLATILVGLPILLVLNAVVGILLAMSPSRARHRFATAVSVIVGLLCVAVSGDALRSIQNGRDWFSGALFFALAALAAYLYFRLVGRPVAEPRNGR